MYKMFRCELCDDYLNLFCGGRLCDGCYRIRTIVKCYDSSTIMKCLEANFLIGNGGIDDEVKETIEKETTNKIIKAIEDNVAKQEEEKKVEPKKPLTRAELKNKAREENISIEEATKKYNE